MRVLYVEDHAEVRELMVLLLEEEGLSVVACASAEAAQSAFAASRFDILMTDVSLPTMRGTELATRLQRDPPRPVGGVLVRLFDAGRSEGVGAAGAIPDEAVRGRRSERLVGGNSRRRRRRLNKAGTGTGIPALAG